jgi:PKD repeat protein
VFNASKSKDTDGTIVGYRWDWTNDGTWDTDWLTRATITHTYTRTGTYTVKLQVKDNGSAQDDDTANVTIKALPVIYASQRALDFLQTTFGLQFTQPFYATDTDGDGIVDTFTDPNHLLTFTRFVNIDGNASFLLSTGNDSIPEFFWDTKANITVLVTYVPVTVADTWIDPEAGEVLIVTNVEKSGWVYIKMTDPYPPLQFPNFTLTVKTTDNRIIPSTFVWRENGVIYVLDDPATQYLFVYAYTVLPPVFNPPNGTIFDASFTPPQGTMFNTSRPKITITYFEPVSILTVTLNNQDIAGQITTTDRKTFTFTPTSDLAEGTYTLSLTVEDDDSNTLTSTATYTINLAKPTGGIPWLIIILIGIIVIVIIVLIILRKRLFI